METICSSLIMAFISSLAFIAYKHPVGFKSIYKYLMIILLFILSIISSYNFGVYFAKWKISSDLNSELPLLKLDEYVIPFEILIPIFLFLTIYLILLLKLHKILKIKKL